MKINIDYELSKLEKMSIGELRRQYEQVFDETTTSRHKQYLIKRILWRMQANEEGGLGKRAFKHAMELANEADLRLTTPNRIPTSNGKTKRLSASPALKNCSQELMAGMQL